MIDQIIQVSVSFSFNGQFLEIEARINDRRLMGVSFKASYSCISQTVVFLTVSEVSFDGLLSLRIDLFPFICMS